MIIVVLPQGKFKLIMQKNSINDSNVEQFDDLAVISITDPHRSDQRYFKDQHKNVLNLFFSDVTDKQVLGYSEEYIKQGFEIKIFSDDDAKNIIDFITNNKDKKQWLIHCHAGISRSGAVGLFVSQFFNWDYDRFIELNKGIYPNFFIFNKLKHYFIEHNETR